jgi:hypothetical protein
MTRESIRHTLALLCTVIVAAAPAHAHEARDIAAMPAITLRVHDRAEVEDALMRQAMQRVDDVYLTAGIRVRWETGEGMVGHGDPPTTFDLLIVSDSLWPLPSGPSTEAHVMGRAARAARRAYIYYGRIRDAAVAFKRFPGNLLGDVVAHEVGHLLLPPDSHSELGIMRPNVALSELIEVFDPQQANAMRATLNAPPETDAAY